MEQLKVISAKVPELVKVAKVVFPKWEDEQLENYVLSELSFLKERLELNDYLQKCTAESLIQCFKKAMRDNVSLNLASNSVYIQPQNIKVSGQYVLVASYSLTPEGKISVVRQAGMLLDITRPKLWRDEKSGKIIGGEVEYLKPSNPQPRWEMVDFDESDIKRWMDASTKKNNGKTNPLYTSGVGGGIDSEFMRSKIIKHALAKGLGTNKNETLVLPHQQQQNIQIPVNTDFEEFENKGLELEEKTSQETALPTGQSEASPNEGETPLSEGEELDFSNL